ncbi:hypothetical protein GCM10020331_082200 [Ectobacillus funiculus]
MGKASSRETGPLVICRSRICCCLGGQLKKNAALPLECRGMKQREAYAKVREYLPIFGLGGYERKRPKDLSGGMRQRVSFFCAPS